MIIRRGYMFSIGALIALMLNASEVGASPQAVVDIRSPMAGGLYNLNQPVDFDFTVSCPYRHRGNRVLVELSSVVLGSGAISEMIVTGQKVSQITKIYLPVQGDYAFGVKTECVDVAAKDQVKSSVMFKVAP